MDFHPQKQSVSQLIEQYNRELLEAYQKGQSSEQKSDRNWLDEQYPAPDVSRDISLMKGEGTIDGSAETSPKNEPFLSNPNTSGRTFSGREEAPPLYPYTDTDLQGQVPFPVEPVPPVDDSAPYVGYLQVFVFTALEAEPLRDARVIVTRRQGNRQIIYAAATTDQDGKTPVFSLPSVNPTLSLTPNASEPYTLYDIQVNSDGFIQNVYQDVPVFGDNRVTQPVAMVPLIPGGDNRPRVFRSRSSADL